MLREELEQYVKNIAEIRQLSAPVPSDLSDAEEYGTLLRDNFLVIGRLSEQNGHILKMLKDRLSDDEAMGPDEIRDLDAFCDELLDAYELNNLDPSILSVISAELLKRAAATGDTACLIRQLDREIMICYTMLSITGRLRSFRELAETYRKRGLDAWKRMSVYLEKDAFASLEDDELKNMILLNSRYSTVLWQGADMDRKQCEETYAILEKGLKIADDPEYRELISDINWDRHRMATYYYIAILTEYHSEGRCPADVLEKVYNDILDMKKLWLSAPDVCSEVIPDMEMRYLVMRAAYECGRINREEYHDQMLSLYSKRDAREYGLQGMVINLMLPMEFVLSLDRENISEREQYRLRHLYNDILSYIYHASGSDSLSYILEYISEILCSFIEIPGVMSFEDMCVNCMAALHPSTYVHGIMVAQIARCLAGYMYRREPERFDGLLSDGDRTAVLSYVYHAGLLHDMGKIFVIDTIMTYGRGLTENEFDLIKTHPVQGADILESNETTKAYANVARLHHVWYDGSGGYPAGMTAEGLAEKTVIELVACADGLDAATDSIGRAYADRHTIDDFVAEVKAGAGTRYAPYLVELLEDPAVRKDLEYLLLSGRSNNYTATCRQLITLGDRGSLYGEL